MPALKNNQQTYSAATTTDIFLCIEFYWFKCFQRMPGILGQCHIVKAITEFLNGVGARNDGESVPTSDSENDQNKDAHEEEELQPILFVFPT